MAEVSEKAADSFLARVLRHRAWILVCVTILFTVVVRVHLREMPLERDEGEYAYAGQLILQGVPPYELAYNMKLPGTYAAYALIMAVFGQTPAGIHLGLALVNAASIVLMFLLGRRLLDDTAGVTAAVAYALMSLSPSVLGLAAHATHFVVLPALGGALLLLRASETGRFRLLFTSGFLFGLAYVMKQHGLMFGVFGLGYLVWSRAMAQREPHSRRFMARPKPFRWAIYGKEIGTFAAGLALPYVLVCLVLWWAGVLPNFLFWTISYARKYVTLVSFDQGDSLMRRMVGYVALPNFLFWILAALGALLMWWESRLEKHRFFLPSLLVCSCVATAIGLYFRPHYFILLLPALALLAGVAVSRGFYLLKHDNTIELLVAVSALGLFGVSVGFALIVHGQLWFATEPALVSRMIYENTLFQESVRIAQYIRTNTPPDATIAVLGSEPEIPFYAKRRSATGYIYMYPLMEYHSYALTMQEEMIKEVEAAKPAYVVLISTPFSWLRTEHSHTRLMEWWAGYQAGHYRLVRTVMIETGMVETPGIGEAPPPKPDDAADASKDEPVLIFKRKDVAPDSAP